MYKPQSYIVPTRMLKRQMVTSWGISGFWVLLSIVLATLATFSFLQADWIVKRNLIVTTYQKIDHNQSENESHRTTRQIHQINNNINKHPHLYKPRSEKLVLSSRKLESELYFDNYDDEGVISSSGSSSNNSYNDIYNEDPNFIPHFKPNEDTIKISKLVTTLRFGIIGVCSNSLENELFTCHLYDHWTQATTPISSLWPMVTMLGGGGCVTLCISAVLSILALTLPTSQMRHRVAITIGHAQTVAVILLMASLLIFPLGFTSEFVRYHCGSGVGPYNVGDCEIGWAYALVLVCSSLSLYCPVLVKFTWEVRYDSLPKYL